jgi:hypothetical protein
MADSDDVKTATDQLQATYENMRQCAATISGLLQLGEATCDEVQTYNLWALATYNAQVGIIQTIKAGGEGQGLPDAPEYPTLFAWRGIPGEQAINIDCSGQPTSLSGAMQRALAGPTPNSTKLSLKEIQIITTDQYLMNPQDSPSFAQLLAAQDAVTTKQKNGLGIGFAVVILIAALSTLITVTVVSVLSYLKSSNMQKEQTARTQLQSQAFATFTAARLQCLQACVQGGGSEADCTASCSQLIKAPDIGAAPGQSAQWGFLQYLGLTVVIGGAAYVGWRVYERKLTGQPLFPGLQKLLPEHSEA